MKKLLITLFLVYLYKSSFAQNEDFKNAINFKSDNDSYLFYGQDRYYTNGIFISFQRATNQLNNSPNVEKKIWEFSVSQKMYNSYSGNVKNAKQQDRPFSAYLYGSSGLSWFFKDESIIKTEVQLGVLGESALGRQSQQLIHDLFGFYEINGWEHQIKDMFAVNGLVQYSRLITRSNSNKIDLSAESNLNLGNINNSVGVGLNFRAGSFNQLFQSAATNSSVSNNSKTAKITQKEFFFYLKPSLSLRATDATIQGGTNKVSPVTFGIKPYVFSQVIGFTYNSNRFTFNYYAQFNTRELKSKALPHQFGSFSLNYRFN